MKLRILPLLCMAISSVRGECKDGAVFAHEGCKPDPFLAKIVCVAEAECECTSGTGIECSDVIPDGLLAGVTVAQMDGPKCREICEASNVGADLTAPCDYFRWEEVPGAQSSEVCSLLGGDQCTQFESCPAPHCKSGQAGCREDLVKINCPAGATFASGHVHWTCINPAESGYIDIYGEEEVIPGTICSTDRKCLAFDTDEEDVYGITSPDTYHTLVVECNSTTGTWMQYSLSTNDPKDYIEDNKLVDPPCDVNPEPLVLDAKVLTESGVSFICSDSSPDQLDIGEFDLIVTAPNTCALLCNFHNVMTIEPKYEESEGSSRWWKYTTGGGDGGEEASKDNVYCWNPPATTPPPNSTTTTTPATTTTTIEI